MKKLLLILLCLPMIGFGQNDFDEYKTFKNQRWNSDSVAIFNYKVSDCTFKNTIKIKLRHTVEYEFQNLFLFIETDVIDTVELMLANKEGMWLGSGIGDVREFEFEYQNVKLFSKKGNYSFKIEHAMRYGMAKKIQVLNNVLAIGLSVEEKNDNKAIERHCAKYYISLKEKITCYVEDKINCWQQKGEFEKTTDYLVRVNEKTRTVKIKAFQEAAIELLKLDFLNSIDFSNIELDDYDADNEAFLLKDSKLGDLVISVPISEAQEFKKSFASVKFLNAECVIIDDRFVLSYLKLKVGKNMKSVISFYNGKEIITRTAIPPVEYSYNLNDAQDYAITDIEYEFSSIEIDDITSVKNTKSSHISTNKLKIGTSSVNINIPTNKNVNHRYALVIGNEDYTSYQRTLNYEQNVDYAENDANIFKKYCLNTLGVKEDNMFFLLNATAGQMSQEIDLISKILSKLGNEAELIVYYAGHGYPDELTKIPYLIPVDVSATNLSSAIKLSEIYTKLSSTGASKVTVFLDACFTGGGRNSGLIASRGVKVKPKEGSLSGNLVVFSASSGDQSSLPYHKEGHGMFTYHLLKKLQETKGDVSMGELSDYLDDSVSLQSLKENKKEQDPKVNTSQKVINDWRNWKF